MLAFTAALITATMALVAKIIFDAFDRYRLRQGVAAGLAGEIRAYIELLQPEKMSAALRAFARLPRAERIIKLSAFGPLPSSHPVFDKVADRIGLLSVDIALDISKFYNVVTGFRLLATGASTERFLNLPDEIQTAQLEFVAAGIEKYILGSATLTAQLEAMARQSFVCYVYRCAP
jgi:hypothetical protein